jgi:hypothetical protein
MKHLILAAGPLALYLLAQLATDYLDGHGLHPAAAVILASLVGLCVGVVLALRNLPNIGETDHA